MKTCGKLLLLKGENYKKELEEAKQNWYFEYNISESLTNKNSAIVLNHENSRSCTYI
jgi:hypothetical protein